MNSDPLSALETIDRITRFHAGARSFAEREKGLERARQLRESGRRQTLDETRAAIEKQHQAALASLRDEAARACAHLESTARIRRIRLDKGQISVRHSVIGAIQATEGQHRAALQREYMEAGRRREQTLTIAQAAFEEGSASAKAIHGRFTKMEKAAVSGLRGYGSLQRRLLLSLKDTETPQPWPGTLTSLEDTLTKQHEELSASVKRLRKAPLVACFAAFPIILQIFLLLGIGAAVPLVAPALGMAPVSWALSLGIAGTITVLLIVLWTVGRKPASTFVTTETERFASAKALRLRHREMIDSDQRLAIETAEAEYNRVKSAFEQGLKEKPGASGKRRYANPDAVEQRAQILREKLGAHLQSQIDSVHQDLATRTAALEHERDKAIARLIAETTPDEDPAAPFERLVGEWRQDLLPLASSLEAETRSAKEESISLGLPTDPRRGGLPTSLIPAWPSENSPTPRRRPSSCCQSPSRCGFQSRPTSSCR